MDTYTIEKINALDKRVDDRISELEALMNKQQQHINELRATLQKCGNRLMKLEDKNLTLR